MKKIIFIILFVISNLFIMAQNEQYMRDEEAIKKVSLDYIEGYYSGDVMRMEKAIHPELNKMTVVQLSRSNRSSIVYTTYTQLIEITRDSTGILEPKKRNIQISIPAINEDAALVKIVSSKFIDYLQLIKINKEWKIVNILWNTPGSIKDFNPDMEKAAITKTANYYIEGFFSADPHKLEIALGTDFNLLTYFLSKKSGKTILYRQKYLALIENSLNSNNKLEEYRRHFKVNIFDIAEGMAIGVASSFRSNEYFQMGKINGEWKVLNAVSKPIPINTIEEAQPVMVNEPLPDFTLPVYGGGEFSISKLKGKNILLVFPRGLNGVNSWCAYCQYQYLDLADVDKKLNLINKYDLEIAFVLPYNKEMLSDWFERFNEATEYLEEVKSIKDPKSQIQKETIAFIKKHYPKTFNIKKGEVKPTIPVLIDEERKVSTRFRLFTKFWNGVSIEQNIPAIYLVDKSGIVQFKYISQMTYDRLDSEKLLEEIKRVCR